MCGARCCLIVYADPPYACAALCSAGVKLEYFRWYTILHGSAFSDHARTTNYIHNSNNFTADSRLYNAAQYFRSVARVHLANFPVLSFWDWQGKLNHRIRMQLAIFSGLFCCLLCWCLQIFFWTLASLALNVRNCLHLDRSDD